MDNRALPIVIVVLIIFLFSNTSCAGTHIKPIEKVPVTFINENPGVTQLGLAKFILDKYGNKVDYKVLDLVWNYKIYVIDLEPGTYGITQYVPKYQKIISYQTFEVKDEPIIVKFRRL